MRPEEELTLPLRFVLWRAAVRFLTFASTTDRWSHLSATERAERRARWPAWRRAVRPVGVGAFWLGVICSVALGEDSSPTMTVLRVGWTLLLISASVIGIRDWLRDVPPKRAVPATAAGYFDPAPSRSAGPGVAPEHPTP